MKNTIIYDRATLYSSNGGASTEDRMLFCKHKWRILREINKYAPNAELPYKIIFILTCDKCGKIKKVNGI